MVPESVELARLYTQNKSWKQTIEKAAHDRTTSLPKAASNRRTIREIVHRLSSLTETELWFLAQKADRPEQEALLWLATCRAYQFVGEFAIEVVRERFQTHRPDLPLDTFDYFFENKAEWVPDLSAISPTTRRKLRQILFRILRESGLIDSSNKIRTFYLSPRLHALIANNKPNDLQFYPGTSL